jgi:CBS domain-containing protein
LKIADREAAMTVKAILDLKGRNVVTIEASATLLRAIHLLAERKIGAVLIVEDKRISGILSERDIVRAFALSGASALDASVDSVMTRKVIKVRVHETIAEIMERMTDGKFRHVPVVDDSGLAGIISIGDVVKHRIGEIEHESEALRDYIQTA